MGKISNFCFETLCACLGQSSKADKLGNALVNKKGWEQDGEIYRSLVGVSRETNLQIVKIIRGGVR